MFSRSVYQRTDRVSDVLKRDVADILSREVKDPRLRFVTVTHVRVSKDLRDAKIFFTTLVEGEERAAVLQGLKKAAGFVQRKLGGRLQMRNVPHLSFEYDTAVEYGSRMESILKSIEEDVERGHQ